MIVRTLRAHGATDATMTAKSGFVGCAKRGGSRVQG